MRKIVKNTSSGQRAQQLINPTKDKKRFDRIFRLGGWYDSTYRSRLSRRSDAEPIGKSSIIGFRLVRNLS